MTELLSAPGTPWRPGFTRRTKEIESPCRSAGAAAPGSASRAHPRSRRGPAPSGFSASGSWSDPARVQDLSSFHGPCSRALASHPAKESSRKTPPVRDQRLSPSSATFTARGSTSKGRWVDAPRSQSRLDKVPDICAAWGGDARQGCRLGGNRRGRATRRTPVSAWLERDTRGTQCGTWELTSGATGSLFPNPCGCCPGSVDGGLSAASRTKPSFKSVVSWSEA